MIVELGHFALILAACVALLQGVLPLAGTWGDRQRWQSLARPAATLQFLLIAASFAALAKRFDSAISVSGFIVFSPVCEQAIQNQCKSVNKTKQVEFSTCFEELVLCVTRLISPVRVLQLCAELLPRIPSAYAWGTDALRP